MPSVPIIIELREKRREKARRNPSAKSCLACSTVLSLGLVVVPLLLVIWYSWLIQYLPSPRTMSLLLDPPDGLYLQPTRIFDQSGEHLLLALEDPASAGWKYTSLPKEHPLVLATIASLDPQFWHHPGFTLKGITKGEHPTLAQRLVVDMLLENEKPGFKRNVRERILASQITAMYGRQKILEWYLNKVKYGTWIYGADAGARVYFDKKTSELTLPEAALLAAIAEAPELNPLDAPANIALEKQKRILQSMLELGLVKPEAAFQAKQTPVNLRKKTESQPEVAPAFVGLALDEVNARFGKERVARGGLRILTTIDYDLQIQANCAVVEHLRQLRGLPEAGTSQDCQAARLLPSLPVQAGTYTGTLSSSLIILDPHTGYILAMAGNAADSTSSHPLTRHPAGTLITPFIYLTAFTRGLSPASMLWDIPANLPLSLSNAAIPGIKFHGPVRLRTALANDYFSPAVQLIGLIGADNVERTIQQMGLSTIDRTDIQASLTQPPLLSGLEVNLFEIVQAYAIFANQGIQVGQLSQATLPESYPSHLQPFTVLGVATNQGEIWLECSSRSVNCSAQLRPVVSPQLAYLAINVLSDEIARWPSLGHPNPLEIGRTAGAKMGSYSNGGWTVGFTPQLVVGAWTGTNQSETAPAFPEAALFGAARLWHAMIQYASRNLPAQTWAVPPGINTLEVCDPSGMLPTANCPTVVSEVFLSGNEPTQADNLYQVFQINRETGRLATVFTPPELVDEQVFMVLPPEAVEWGQSTRIPRPPADYDVIIPPTHKNPGASLDAPLMFAHIKGSVKIAGSASGDDFSYFRLQVGKGLNPHEWIQIGQDNSKPVANDLLGEWDTSGLSGLYAIRLLVVRKDRTVDTATIQVSVDNQLPTVTILSPLNNQIFTDPEFNTIILQTNVADNLSIQRVEFYLDRRLIASLYQTPYQLAWAAKAGEHAFQVIVYDLAGNSAEASVTFTVNP